MKKILLTGKSSFLGRNLEEYFLNFNDTYKLCAPSHYALDLLDEEKVSNHLKKNNYDFIIHAGMYNKIFNHPDMLEKSILMYFNLEKNASHFGKMYYFGSGAEFDKTKDIVKVKEESLGTSIPKNYYGLAKYIMAKNTIYTKNIYNLRLFGIYGKYEDWTTKFISNACCRAIKNIPVTLSQNMKFDYLYIDDFCKITKKIIDKGLSFHDYNVVSGTVNNLKSIANYVLQISGANNSLIVSKEGFKPEYTASNERLLKEIEVDFTPIEQGIELLYEWYKKNKNIIDIKKIVDISQ